MTIVFIFFLLGCAFVFPAITFLSDYMEASSFDNKARIDYVGFTLSSAFFVTFLAMGVYYLVTL